MFLHQLLIYRPVFVQQSETGRSGWVRAVCYTTWGAVGGQSLADAERGAAHCHGRRRRGRASFSYDPQARGAAVVSAGTGERRWAPVVTSARTSTPDRAVVSSCCAAPVAYWDGSAPPAHSCELFSTRVSVAADPSTESNEYIRQRLDSGLRERFDAWMVRQFPVEHPVVALRYLGFDGNSNIAAQVLIIGNPDKKTSTSLKTAGVIAGSALVFLGCLPLLLVRRRQRRDRRELDGSRSPYGRDGEAHPCASPDSGASPKSHRSVSPYT